MPALTSPADAFAAVPASRAAEAAAVETAVEADARVDGLMRLAALHFGVAAACVIPGEADGHWCGAGLGVPLREALRRVQDASGAPWTSGPLAVADTGITSACRACLAKAHALPFRFITAWPLRGETGACIGSLCLIDHAPRELGDAERASLDDFARIASALVEQRAGAAAQRDETQALRARERLLTLAIAGSGTGIWDRNVVTGEIHYSTGWKAMLGYADDEVTNRIEDSYQRLHPEDAAYVKAAMQAHFEGRTESYSVEHRIRCKDGRYKWICSRGKVVSRDGDGRALRMVGTTTDVTAMREMAERLRESVNLVTNLTNEVPGLVFQCLRRPDGHLSFPYASAGIVEIYELAPQDVAQDAARIDALIHPDDLEAWRDSFVQSAAFLQPWHLEYRVRLPKQGLRWRQGDARPQRLANGVTVWHGLITDVTERKRVEAELHEFATTDGLTQLSNRRHFMSRLEAQLSQLRRTGGPPAAVLMCDLDHFKSINDRWGHAVGDHALRHFADILRTYLRAGDVAGRVGGEEFAVLIGAAGLEGARAVARRIQRHIAEQPLTSVEGPIAMTVSIGITEMAPDDADVEAALSRSDFALYRAKKNGRNRIECA